MDTRMRVVVQRVASLGLLGLLTVGCSSDPEGPAGDVGNDSERDVSRDSGRDLGTDVPEDTDEDVTTDVIGDVSGDTVTDAVDDTLFCTADDDLDGHVSVVCGGDDCDDSDPRVHGGQSESCDELDNNCNDLINEDIVCAFYAHTDSALYQIDPFAGEATVVIESIPEMWDIDTHPDGTLYALNGDALYALNEAAGRFDQVAPLSGFVGQAFGMAINQSGESFVVTTDALYGLNLETGAMTLVGQTAPYSAAGDCVVNKDNSLFMSSDHIADSNGLVGLSGQDASATNIGDIGFDRIYGLTAAWGRLFGVTSNGLLIEIDQGTGEGTLLHEFTGLRWFGAASTPAR